MISEISWKICIKMVSDDFLDTNIIINYINCGNGSQKIVKKSHDYVSSIEGSVLLCGYVFYELENYKKNKKFLFKSVLNKMKDDSYDFFDLLGSRQIPAAKKLYLKVKDIEIQKVSKIFSKERILFEIGLDRFMELFVKEIIIQKKDVDESLAKKINDLISNIDDCRVLASALQCEKVKERAINFVTADDDFDSAGYEYLKEHFEINYAKEKWQFPKLVNLLED
ncbi:MAG: hypothetical protein PF487_01220 [Bacteroidales bacterium]|jgi:hypothetical protein|nr:hypothetical protein [Bacteroidales bacterium]